MVQPDVFAFLFDRENPGYRIVDRGFKHCGLSWRTFLISNHVFVLILLTSVPYPC